jgi:hypothetical protein
MATNAHTQARSTHFLAVAAAALAAAFGAPAAAAEAEHAPPTGRPGVAAYFTERSYAPGETARLVVADSSRVVSLRVRHSGAEQTNRSGSDILYGVTVGGIRRLPSRSGTLEIRIGDWPSGLYYAELRSATGLTGYATFVVRPRRLGELRVAVVLPTNTWQAYNFRDGDTWYADSRVDHVSIERPYLNRGVPPHFRQYDLGFLRWLERSGRRADVLSDDDLDAIATGDRLAKLYDLVVFPGHTEYETPHAYAIVQRYRDLGGNLAFLSANNFFYRVERRSDGLYRLGRFRDRGQPEARLIGVQYLNWNEARYANAPYVIANTSAAPWLFAGTGLHDGSSFGRYGIEIDARTPASPAGTTVIARVPNVFGPGASAEMTYYKTGRGAKVFAAGVINFGGSALWTPVSRLLDNLWEELSRP